MPANLTPEYLEAEKRLKEARTPEERLLILEEMLSLIPKHKGTDRMQGELRRRISKTRTELEKKGPVGRKRISHHVEKEGAGQVALAGPPNSGKSSLIRALTTATPEVAPYEFTTRSPVPAMMEYEDVQVQLVDLPPVSDRYMEYWVPAIIRAADAVLLVAGLSDEGGEPLSGTEETLEILERAKIRLVGDPAAVEAEAEEVRGIAFKKTLLVCTMGECPEAADNLEILREFYGRRFPILPVSARSGQGLEELRQRVYGQLGKIRVYSKAPGKPSDMARPYIIKAGTTVVDFAAAVHKDFREGLKFARIWGSGRFEGQKVNRDFVLSDRDVVELHL